MALVGRHVGIRSCSRRPLALNEREESFDARPVTPSPFSQARKRLPPVFSPIDSERDTQELVYMLRGNIHGLDRERFEKVEECANR